MDNIGNWLYVIIIVGVAISSLIKKSNKNKDQSGTGLPAPIPQGDTFSAPPVPSEKKKKKTPPPPNRFNQKGQPENYFNEGYSSLNLKEVSLLEESEKEVTLADELNLDDNEEIRKAIIYSEIFNRKY